MERGRKPNMKAIKEAVKYRKNGLTIREIAFLMGVHEKQVSRYLEQAKKVIHK